MRLIDNFEKPNGLWVYTIYRDSIPINFCIQSGPIWFVNWNQFYWKHHFKNFYRYFVFLQKPSVRIVRIICFWDLCIPLMLKLLNDISICSFFFILIFILFIFVLIFFYKPRFASTFSQTYHSSLCRYIVTVANPITAT